MRDPNLGTLPRAGHACTHELAYRAGTWSHHRQLRVILVVAHRPGEQRHLFLDHLFPLTNASEEEVSGEEVLERYRHRGRTEKDFGDEKRGLATKKRPTCPIPGRRVRIKGDVHSQHGHE